MPKIEIDQDLYDHLVKNTREIGESASSILRRLLNANSKPERPSDTTSALVSIADTRESQRRTVISPAGPKDGSAKPPSGERTPENLAKLSTATSRFLTLLGWLHEDHKERFRVVLGIGGRQRRYFAETEQELEDAGTSVYPVQIPGCRYWVVSNNDTPKKARIAGDVLKALGVREGEIARWVQAVGGRPLSPVRRTEIAEGPGDLDDLRI